MKKSDAIILEALRRGPLVKSTLGNWRFGRRGFNGRTVARAIASGYAIREGNIVRAA